MAVCVPRSVIHASRDVGCRESAMGLRTDLNGLRLSRKGRKVHEGKNSTEERFEGVKYSSSYIHSWLFVCTRFSLILLFLPSNLLTSDKTSSLLPPSFSIHFLPFSFLLFFFFLKHIIWTRFKIKISLPDRFGKFHFSFTPFFISDVK